MEGKIKEMKEPQLKRQLKMGLERESEKETNDQKQIRRRKEEIATNKEMSMGKVRNSH